MALSEAFAAHDVAAIAAHFSQPHALADVVDTNAYIAAHIPTAIIFKRGSEWFYPWYFSPSSLGRQFLLGSAAARGEIEVIAWFYASRERAELMGDTLALALCGVATSVAPQPENSAFVVILEMLLTSPVFLDYLSADKQQDVLEKLLSAWSPVHPDVTNVIVAHGADISSLFVGQTMHLTSVEMVDVVVQEGAIVVGADFGRNSGAWENVQVARRLLELGVSLGEGARALVSASQRGLTDLVALLLTQGFADVNSKFGGRTPLMAAAWANRPVRTHGRAPHHVIELLLESGADIHVKGDDGSTLLHAAALSDRGENTRLLLENGVDPNEPNVDGRTPLSYLVDINTYNLSEHLELLLLYGADPYCVSNGETAFSKILRLKSGLAFVRDHPEYFDERLRNLDLDFTKSTGLGSRLWSTDSQNPKNCVINAVSSHSHRASLEWSPCPTMISTRCDSGDSGDIAALQADFFTITS